MLRNIQTRVRSSLSDRLDLVSFVSAQSPVHSTSKTTSVNLHCRMKISLAMAGSDGFGPVGAANPPMPYRSSRHEQRMISLLDTFSVKDAQMTSVSAANDGRVANLSQASVGQGCHAMGQGITCDANVCHQGFSISSLSL